MAKIKKAWNITLVVMAGLTVAAVLMTDLVQRILYWLQAPVVPGGISNFENLALFLIGLVAVVLGYKKAKKIITGH